MVLQTAPVGAATGSVTVWFTEPEALSAVVTVKE